MGDLFVPKYLKNLELKLIDLPELYGLFKIGSSIETVNFINCKNLDKHIEKLFVDTFNLTSLGLNSCKNTTDEAIQYLTGKSKNIKFIKFLFSPELTYQALNLANLS